MGLCLFLLFNFTANVTAAERVKLVFEGEGLKSEYTDNMSAYLTLAQQKDHPRITLSRIQRLNQKAEAEIQEAMQAFGYYQVKVQHDTETLEQPEPAPKAEADETGEDKPQVAPPRWQVTYQVELGKPVTVSDLDLQILGAAETDEAFQTALKDFPLQSGDVLLHSKYESGKANLTRLAQERGYFKAQFVRKSVAVDREANKASISLHFDSGPRYRFGDIRFEQDKFDEAFLQRYLNFAPDDFYHNKLLLDLRRDLSNSRYFQQVEVIADRTRSVDEATVPVSIKLQPEAENRYSASIGYGTDTGVRGGLGWEKRYRGRYGHYYSLDLSLSQRINEFSALYGIPTGDPRSDSLAFKFGYKTEDLDNKESSLLLAGVVKSHSRNLWGSWSHIQLREDISLEYRYETYTLGSQPEVDSRLLVPGISWSYMQADDPMYTRRGYRISLGLKGAIKSLLSDTSILQTYVNGMYIFPLGSKSRLLLRGEVGFSYMPDFDEVPASMRFFAGGDKSVRGYDYDTLGPRAADGTIIGGQHLITASAEYTYRILEKWDLAVFYDVGNAYDTDAMTLKHSVGLGLHWISPIGTIRLDVAYALDQDDGGIRLHINMGPDL